MKMLNTNPPMTATAMGTSMSPPSPMFSARGKSPKMLVVSVKNRAQPDGGGLDDRLLEGPSLSTELIDELDQHDAVVDLVSG